MTVKRYPTSKLWQPLTTQDGRAGDSEPGCLIHGLALLTSFLFFLSYKVVEVITKNNTFVFWILARIFLESSKIEYELSSTPKPNLSFNKPWFTEYHILISMLIIWITSMLWQLIHNDKAKEGPWGKHQVELAKVKGSSNQFLVTQMIREGSQAKGYSSSCFIKLVTAGSHMQ